MRKNGLSEFELERQDFKIKLKRAVSSPVQQPDDSAAAMPYVLAPAVPLPAIPQSSAAAAQSAATAAASQTTEIKSPMIGTFYRAASPESPDYVEVGSEVTADTVVCLIEAMKVMNEIK